MAEFEIKDEDLVSLNGKVVVLTGAPRHYRDDDKRSSLIAYRLLFGHRSSNSGPSSPTWCFRGWWRHQSFPNEQLELHLPTNRHDILGISPLPL